MSAITTVSYHMLPVASVIPADGGLSITFANGQVGFLDADHPHFETIRIHALAGVKQAGTPVGFSVDADGRIGDLCSAHDTRVRSLHEPSGGCPRCEVGFWSYSPVCVLLRDHPEFERIHALLATAAQTGEAVWVVPHSEDVFEEEPDEEGLLATFPKIMDVRPT